MSSKNFWWFFLLFYDYFCLYIFLIYLEKRSISNENGPEKNIQKTVYSNNSFSNDLKIPEFYYCIVLAPIEEKSIFNAGLSSAMFEMFNVLLIEERRIVNACIGHVLNNEQKPKLSTCKVARTKPMVFFSCLPKAYKEKK
jgi:hypothetical protein